MSGVKAETATAAADDKKMAARQQQSEENEKAGQDVQEQMTNLTAAKDRAQLTQASAMSILDIKVLADLIRGGSGYSGSLYVTLVVLVSVALLLQIVVGLLSLMVSNIKNQFKKFKSGRGMCCRISTESKNQLGDEDQGQIRTAIEDANILSPVAFKSTYPPSRPRPPISDDNSPFEHFIVVEDERQPKPFERQIVKLKVYDTETLPGRNVPPPYEASESEPKKAKTKMVTRLQAYLNQMMDSKEAQIESKVNVEFLEDEITRCKQQLESLHAKTDDLDKEEAEVVAKVTKGREKLDAQEQYNKLHEQRRELKTKNDTSGLVVVQGQLDQLKPEVPLTGDDIKYARKKIDDQIKNIRSKQDHHLVDIRQLEDDMRVYTKEKDEQAKEERKFNITEGKFKLYQKMAENIEKKRSLERITFWQNVINYILYAVFVLNAFIATLSLISDENDDATESLAATSSMTSPVTT